MKRPFAVTAFIGIALFAFLVAPAASLLRTSANVSAGITSSTGSAASRSLSNSKSQRSVSTAIARPAGSSKSSSSKSRTCIQTAVRTREEMLIKALGESQQSALLSYATRERAFDDAWSIADAEQRRKAVMAAWVVYYEEKQRILVAWEESIIAAWAEFIDAATLCGFPDADDKGILMDR